MKFKRILAGVLASAMTVSAGAVPEIISPAVQTVLTASAETDTYGDFEYEVVGNNITITGYENDEAKEITIPAEIDGKPVTSIGENAFCSKNIISVIIPDSVTSIGFGAFDHCSDLTNITIPDSVTSISENAFIATPWFEEKQKEDPLVIINSLLFDGTACKGEVVIPDSVKIIGKGAFHNCQDITSVIIPDSVVSINEDAFLYCLNLKDISFPDSITFIGNKAFVSTPWLEAKQKENPLVIIDSILIDGTTCEGDITIPDSVTSIADGTFYACESLTSITIPDHVESIGDSAFLKCESLKILTIPDSVTYIGSYAFSGCKCIESITIPDGVASIEKGVFSNCTSLAEVTIPDSVTIIGDSSFESCDSLTEVTIPDSAASIEYSAFRGCSSLTEVTIPESVTCIGMFAFGSCKILKEVTILNPDCEIYDYIDTISNGYADGIGYYFNGMICGYENSTAQEYAEEYGYKFGSLGAYAPDKEDDPDEDDKPSEDEPDDNYVPSVSERKKYGKYIYYKMIDEDGDGKYDYASISYCEKDAENVEIPAEINGLPVKKIDSWAFVDTNNLKEITISEGIEVIEDEAFFYCRFLESVNIPESVKKIGSAAFSRCEMLKSIYIPEGVEEIGSINTFYDCKTLKSIDVSENNKYYCCVDGVLFSSDMTELIAYPAGKSGTEYDIPETVTKVGKGAFSGSEVTETENSLVYVDNWIVDIDRDEYMELSEITAREGIIGISELAFQNTADVKGAERLIFCDGLKYIDECAFGPVLGNCANYIKYIELPDSVVEIGEEAFHFCSDLLEINIPKGITEIKDSTFSVCNKMEEITIPDNVTSIGKNAFFGCENLESVTIENPECKIYDDRFTINISNFTSVIRGYENSTAQKYAEKYNYIFESLGEYENTENKETQYGDYLYYQKSDRDNDGKYDNIAIIGCEKNAVSVEIPAEIEGLPVEGIYANAFSGCEKLENIKFPDTLTIIGMNAFENCISLKSINLPDSGISIAGAAFKGCSSLKNVTIPKLARHLEAGVFGACGSLESLTVLSTDCSIESWPIVYNGIDENGEPYFNGILYCYEGSTTQECAEMYGCKYELIGSEPVVTEPVTTTVTVTITAVETASDVNTTATTAGTTEETTQITLTSTESDTTAADTTETSTIPSATTAETETSAVTNETTAETTETTVPVTTTVPTETTKPAANGDISGNGKIDLYDAIAIAEYLVKKRTFTDEDMKIADFNGDGKVDLYDAIGIATYMIKNK